MIRGNDLKLLAHLQHYYVAVFSCHVQLAIRTHRRRFQVVRVRQSGLRVVWLAGGGIRPGTTFGETDDYSYNAVRDPVSVHDLHATLLHCLGIDHTRLTFKFQGRHYRLTDVFGKVVKEILA